MTKSDIFFYSDFGDFGEVDRVLFSFSMYPKIFLRSFDM